MVSSVLMVVGAFLFVMAVDTFIHEGREALLAAQSGKVVAARRLTRGLRGASIENAHETIGLPRRSLHVTQRAEPTPWPDSGRVATAATTPAPAALLTLWGFLLIVLLSNPIRPYTDGAWAAGDLLALAILGGLVGLVDRPRAAAIGVPLGIAAAVALQSFVLAGQAHYQPVVVSDLTGARWLAALGWALVVAVGAMAVGYAIVRVALGASGRDRATAASAQPAGPFLVVFLAMSVVVALVLGISLLTTLRSAYLAPDDEATIHVAVAADGTITSDTESVPTGRTRIVVDRPLSQQATALSLIGPLSPSQLQAVDRKVLPIDTACCYWNYLVPRTELQSPGTYALVVVVHEEPPVDEAEFEAWLRSQPISAARTLTVTAGLERPAPATDAGGDGGRYLTLPVLAALGIAGWAAAGSVARGLRADRPLTAARVVVGLLAGVASAVALASLAMLAIMQAHSPF